MTETNKNDKRSQKGRSMVEMLGVLSIIGVLSVGGISAYSTAMEKHKANELMAATMQEAVLISAQLATGKTNPTLSGINNSLFASASTVPNSDNFKIVLNAVDEDVCEKMKSMLGVSSMVHAISDNCTEMTFHKNLTPKAVTQSGGNSGNSGDNSGEGGTTEPVDPCANVNCGEHGTCVDGACDCEDGYGGDECKTPLSGCQNEGIWNQETQTCTCIYGFSGNNCEICALNPETDCPSGALFDGTCMCAPVPEGTECSSWNTNECGAMMYCHFTPESCNGNTIEAPTKGVCQSIESINPVTVFDWVYFYPYDGLDWWSAQSACKGVGLTMPSLSDMGCPKDGDCDTSDGTILHKLLSGHEVCDDTDCWDEYFSGALINGYWTMDIEGNNKSCNAFVFYGGGFSYSSSAIDKTTAIDTSVLCRPGN
jgi:Tfp pilus assembly protein PilE